MGVLRQNLARQRHLAPSVDKVLVVAVVDTPTRLFQQAWLVGFVVLQIVDVDLRRGQASYPVAEVAEGQCPAEALQQQLLSAAGAAYLAAGFLQAHFAGATLNAHTFAAEGAGQIEGK